MDQDRAVGRPDGVALDLKKAAGTQLAHPQSLTWNSVSLSFSGAWEKWGGGLAAAGDGNQITKLEEFRVGTATGTGTGAAGERRRHWQMANACQKGGPSALCHSTLPCRLHFFIISCSS